MANDTKDVAAPAPVPEKASALPAVLAPFIERVKHGRQLALVFGLAALLALAAGAFLWMSHPVYRVLFGDLSEKDAGEVMAALDKMKVPYKVDPVTGVIKVPEDKVHELRLRLASQGLPKGSGVGFELLEEKNHLGVSQFMESARYQRALEGELARSIMTLDAVEKARVHLALPERSVFIRERREPSASVLLKLYPGRTLSEGQVAAIVHLVASSVPRLAPEKVTVVDQRGRLLTPDGEKTPVALSMDQLEYAKRLEERYTRRILDLLNPVVGVGKVNAQVSVDIDFTETEQTEEEFVPKPEAVRSEQSIEERIPPPEAGIPGALSNQPPGVAVVPQKVKKGEGVSSRATVRHEQTKNYEISKRIRHIKSPVGHLRRLTAAVVLDDRVDGEGKPVALSPEELRKIESLVKQAVGFNEARGDKVSVVHASFAPAQAIIPEIPLWEQPWVMELVKLALFALLAVLFLFLVVRPWLRHVLAKPGTEMVPVEAGELPPPEGALAEMEKEGEEAPEMPFSLPPPPSYEERLKLAKQMIAEDPERAAQVIRLWIHGKVWKYGHA